MARGLKNWQLYFGALLLTLCLASPTTAQECTAYCICNGAQTEICSRPIDACDPPKTSLCASGGCGMRIQCCCAERVFEPSGPNGGTLVFKVSDCTRAVTCEEMCGGGGGFLVHSDGDFSTLLQQVNNSQEQIRRARLDDWAFVYIDMIEGRELNYRPIHASSTRYAISAAMDSGLENYMNPNDTVDVFLHEDPPGSVNTSLTTDQVGLRTHLVENLGKSLESLAHAKMALAIVLDIDGRFDSVQVLFSDPPEFADVLVPEFTKAYAGFAEHRGNGRTMDVFAPRVHSDGKMMGLHHSGSFLLDVHPEEH